MSKMRREILIVFVIILSAIQLLAIPITDQRAVETDHPSPMMLDDQLDATSTSYSSPWTNTDWNALADKEIQKAINVANSLNSNKAKNVILFLGDGMGLPTVAAARIYNAQLRNLDHENIYLTWENFPHVGLSRTYNVDRSTPDSAGTGTAYMTGVKANFYTIGVNEHVTLGNCSAVKNNKLRSVIKESIVKSKWTGLVTTTRVTHASPAAGYAHVADRNWEGSVPTTVANYEQCQDIAYQLVNDSENQQIRVILGGGRQMFLPSSVQDPEFFVNGSRIDGNDLIQVWQDLHKAKGDRYQFVKNITEFNAVDSTTTDYLMGLFNPSHMDYEVDRIKKSPIREPSLADMTEKAIKILQRSENGFFLFVEGGRIDLSHHDNRAYKALNDTLAFSDAILRASQLTSDQDTLIVVTADHSHVFTFGGYSSFKPSVFGFSDGESPTDGKPFLQLHYANGPGYYYHRMDNGIETSRRNLTEVDVLDPEFLQDSAVPLASETHGGEDVGIYASGPFSHLFHGVHEQNYIGRAMMYASCVGRDLGNHCTVTSSASQLPITWLHHVIATITAAIAWR